MNKEFSSGDEIKFGFKMLNENFVFLATVYLLAIIIQFFPNVVHKHIFGGARFLGGFLILGSILLGLIIQLDLIKIALKFCAGGRGVYNDLLSSSKLLLKYLGCKILFTLIILGGTILLVVPGVIWAVKYSFYSYFIAAEGVDPGEALRKSAEITKGARWNLFFFGILLIAINIIGFICFGIGILVTLPVTQIAAASVFTKLRLATYPLPSQSPSVTIPEIISEGSA